MLATNNIFRKMFIAYGLATLGSWFDYIAVAILIGYNWHASPLTIALLPLMYAGPGILLGQFAGIWADRRSKLRIMIVTDLIRAVFTILLIFAPNPAWALPLIFFRSAATVFHTPAQQAMTRFAVNEEELFQATALNGMVFQMGKVLGPLIGGTVAAIFAPALCMLLNVFCFILSACFYLSVKTTELANDQTDGENEKIEFVKVWKEGWSIIFANRILLSSLLFSLMGMIAIQLVDAQFPVILREKAPESSQLVGWVVASVGIGALCTVAWFNRYKDIHAYGWMLGGGTALIGILFAWFGYYQSGQSFGWLLLAALIGGVGTGLTSVASNYLRQKETPKEAVGRVMGIYDSLQSAVFIGAPLAGGILIETIGAGESFLLIGFVIGAIGMFGVLLQKWIWGEKSKNKLAKEKLKQLSQ